LQTYDARGLASEMSEAYHDEVMRGAECMDVAGVLAAPKASAMEIIGMVVTRKRAGQ
jgi:hypothetical protein